MSQLEKKPAQSWINLGVDQPKLEGQQLEDAIRKKIEYYFSRENLQTDAFLVSRMNPDMWVDICVLTKFKGLVKLNATEELVARVMRQSKSVVVSDNGKSIKPNFTVERKILILRDIPSNTPKEEIETIFSHLTGNNAPIDYRSEVGDNWFIGFESEEKCLNAHYSLTGKQFRGQPVRARVKSESVSKLLLIPQPAYPQPRAPEQAAFGYNDGYYFAADVSNTGFLNSRGNRGPRTRDYQQHQQHHQHHQHQPHQQQLHQTTTQQSSSSSSLPQNTSTTEFSSRGGYRDRDRGGKLKRKKPMRNGAYGNPNSITSPQTLPTHAGSRTPNLSPNNFPPLPSAKGKQGYGSAPFKRIETSELFQVLDIIKSSLTKPEFKNVCAAISSYLEKPCCSNGTLTGEESASVFAQVGQSFGTPSMSPFVSPMFSSVPNMGWPAEMAALPPSPVVANDSTKFSNRAAALSPKASTQQTHQHQQYHQQHHSNLHTKTERSANSEFHSKAAPSNPKSFFLTSADLTVTQATPTKAPAPSTVTPTPTPSAAQQQQQQQQHSSSNNNHSHSHGHNNKKENSSQNSNNNVASTTPKTEAEAHSFRDVLLKKPTK